MAGSIVPGSASQRSFQGADSRTQADVYAGGLFKVVGEYDSAMEPAKGYLSSLSPGELVQVELQLGEEGVGGPLNMFDRYVYGTRKGCSEKGWLPVAILDVGSDLNKPCRK